MRVVQTGKPGNSQKKRGQAPAGSKAPLPKKKNKTAAGLFEHAWGTARGQGPAVHGQALSSGPGAPVRSWRIWGLALPAVGRVVAAVVVVVGGFA